MAAALDAAIPVPHFLGMFGSHEALRSPDASPAANRGPALEGRGDQGHEDHGNLGSKATTNHVSGSLLCKAQSISGCLAPDRMAARRFEDKCWRPRVESGNASHRHVWCDGEGICGRTGSSGLTIPRDGGCAWSMVPYAFTSGPRICR